MRFTYWMITLFVASACGSTESEVETPRSNVGEIEAGDPVVEGEQSTEPDHAETPSTPAATAVSPEGGTVGPYDVSETEAQRLCSLEVDEEVRVQRCAFGVGQDLPGNARVDVLEFNYSEMADVNVAMLIIRTPEDREYPITFTLATAEEAPGMEDAYTLGTISVTGTRITVPVEFVSTTYPNTGDPNQPSGAYEERSSYTVQCEAMNGVYACERIER